MRFETLSATSTKVAHMAMMEAFSDYIVPIKLTLDQFEMKLKRDNVVADLSPIAIDIGRIVGFNLLGLGEWNGKLTAYDGATGVIPSHRGQKLTQQLFDHILPKLKSSNVEQVLLEVIIGNDAAIHVYKKMGFEVTRDLICYKGEPTLDHKLPEGFSYVGISNAEWDKMTAWHDFQPSWQNSLFATRNVENRYELIGVLKEGVLVGYGAIYHETGYLAHFAIDPEYRRNGLGGKLLSFIASYMKKPITTVNIEANDLATNAFLNKIGMKEILRQHEMIKSI